MKRREKKVKHHPRDHDTIYIHRSAHFYDWLLWLIITASSKKLYFIFFVIATSFMKQPRAQMYQGFLKEPGCHNKDDPQQRFSSKQETFLLLLSLKERQTKIGNHSLGYRIYAKHISCRSRQFSLKEARTMNERAVPFHLNKRIQHLKGFKNFMCVTAIIILNEISFYTPLSALQIKNCRL